MVAKGRIPQASCKKCSSQPIGSHSFGAFSFHYCPLLLPFLCSCKRCLFVVCSDCSDGFEMKKCVVCVCSVKKVKKCTQSKCLQLLEMTTARRCHSRSIFPRDFRHFKLYCTLTPTHCHCFCQQPKKFIHLEIGQLFLAISN